MAAMRKSRYVTILLAGVATSLAACDQHDMTKDEGAVYSDPAACAKDVDAAACEQAYVAAKEEHTKQAPKFTTQEECLAAGFTQCESTEVKTASGASSSFFMPMMMGYMMGRMMGGGMGGFGAPNAPPQQTSTGAGAAGAAGRPVYGDRNGYLYTGGQPVGRVAPGTTSLPSGTAVRSVSRGGFGARGMSGGS
ncbi:MAG: DUF1190 domain-containing protein [Rhodospirillaceae bacterium]|nr:DUF1190 domain-containing protein [Rhodospirillaceae bacterium]